MIPVEPVPSSLQENPERWALLEAAHRASPRLAFLWNGETGQYEDVDPSTNALLGYTAEELAANGPAFLAGLLHSEAGEPGCEPFPTQEEEVRLQHRDGTWRWFRVRRAVFDRTAEGAPRRLLLVLEDISRQREAEEGLQEAEERFKSVMKQSLDAVNILDAEGRLLYSSPAGERLHGVPATEYQGRSIYLYVHPEDLPVFRRALSGVLAEPEQAQTVQYRLASRTRGWVWVETVVVNQLANPAIRGILCDIRDITDRKLAEEGLLRSEALLAEAQHLAALGSFEVNLKTGESIWSEGMYRLLDRDSAGGPLRYQDLIELIHPEDRKVWTSARKLLYSDSVPLRSEFRIVCRDRSVHFLTIKARPVVGSNGAVEKVVGAIQDISERKRIEEALRDSMNAYREVTDFLPQTVFEMDASGRLTFTNRQGFLAFGLSQEDFDQGIQVIDLLAPEDRPRAAEDMARALGEPSPGHEYLAMKQDGSAFPVLVQTVPIVRNGRRAGLRGIIVDISERKKAEEERAWLQERLRHSEKMEAIGQLAGGIAHDFNNHLSAILGFSEILLDRLTEPDLVRYTQGVIKACSRSGELTRQLLAFARKGKYLTVLVDLDAMIAEVIQILQHSIDKRILIRQANDGRPALVLGDPNELQNALMNLALNARDAMPDGGELTFFTEVRVLDEQSCKRLPYEITPGPFVQVSVSDTGHGMDRDVQQHIFEPFFTTKEQGKGTGLGLASVYGTVKNHRGAILVYSERDRGSCFKLLLPLAELHEGEAAEPVEIHRESRALGIAPGTRQILVVEDEELVGQMLLVQLRGLGFRAVLMPDGLSAVEHFRQAWRDIDLVIMDLVMPHLSGIETFRGLKSVNSQVKVVLSSGYSVDGEAQKIMQEGAVAFLQKPYQLGELTHVLSRVFTPQSR